MGKGDMINMESQRQVFEHKDFCPESCSFCPGVGLSHSIWRHRADFASCGVWQNYGLESLEGKEKVFVPSKLFCGGGWKKVLNKIPQESLLIVVMSRLDFDPETLNQILIERAVQVWVVPERGADVMSALGSIFKKSYEKIFFYCPLYSSETDQFLTSQELVKLFSKIKSRFDGILVRPPQDIEIYNPTLSKDFYSPKERVLINESASDNVDISVVIPSFNNESYLNRVLRNLKSQTSKDISFEVIAVDDGSSDNTIGSLKQSFDEGLYHENFKLIHFPRSGSRKMGDFQFRAGMARDIGVKHAKGKIFAFLDSDMIVPRDYVDRLYKNHIVDGYDVVQIQRLYLKDFSSRSLRSYDSVDRKNDVFHPEGGYWKDFFSSQVEWDHTPFKWKYVCTYGLSVTGEKYHKVGGFRSVFNSYGFEDTDLGYRLAKEGCRFHKSSIEAYHLWQDTSKSEFLNSPWKRQKLLNRSANIFFRHNLDEEVFGELRGLMSEDRPWRHRFRMRRR